MPHLHIESFKPLTLPTRCGDVEFLFQADYKDDKEGALIATRYKGREFFLVHKKGIRKSFSKAIKSPALLRTLSSNTHSSLTRSAQDRLYWIQMSIMPLKIPISKPMMP